MTHAKNPSPVASQRQAAKLELARRDNLSKPTMPMTEAEVRKQFHELQVNQIELEMQNSELGELQHARREIEEGLARYIDLYDFAPIGYFTLDCGGTLREVNLTGARLLGMARDDLPGRNLGQFIVPGS